MESNQVTSTSEDGFQFRSSINSQNLSEFKKVEELLAEFGINNQNLLEKIKRLLLEFSIRDQNLLEKVEKLLLKSDVHDKDLLEKIKVMIPEDELNIRNLFYSVLIKDKKLEVENEQLRSIARDFQQSICYINAVNWKNCQELSSNSQRLSNLEEEFEQIRNAFCCKKREFEQAKSVILETVQEFTKKYYEEKLKTELEEMKIKYEKIQKDKIESENRLEDQLDNIKNKKRKKSDGYEIEEVVSKKHKKHKKSKKYKEHKKSKKYKDKEKKQETVANIPHKSNEEQQEVEKRGRGLVFSKGDSRQSNGLAAAVTVNNNDTSKNRELESVQRAESGNRPVDYVSCYEEESNHPDIVYRVYHFPQLGRKSSIAEVCEEKPIPSTRVNDIAIKAEEFKGNPSNLIYRL